MAANLLTIGTLLALLSIRILKIYSRSEKNSGSPLRFFSKRYTCYIYSILKDMPAKQHSQFGPFTPKFPSHFCHMLFQLQLVCKISTTVLTLTLLARCRSLLGALLTLILESRGLQPSTVIINACNRGDTIQYPEYHRGLRSR